VLTLVGGDFLLQEIFPGIKLDGDQVGDLDGVFEVA
jgi:hypothetical protein